MQTQSRQVARLPSQRRASVSASHHRKVDPPEELTEKPIETEVEIYRPVQPFRRSRDEGFISYTLRAISALTLMGMGVLLVLAAVFSVMPGQVAMFFVGGAIILAMQGAFFIWRE